MRPVLRRAAVSALAAAAVMLAAGCAGNGTVVDKGYRVTPSRVNGHTTYVPCWWVKVRDDATSKTHTTCTSHTRWKTTRKGDPWTE